MTTFTSFLAVAAVAVVVPGPDTFVVLRTSLAEGARAGTWAAAGSAAGNLVWGAASVLGVAALLHTSATAFSALKLLGAAYLVVLGVQALRAAARGDALAPEGAAERPERSSAAAFRRGVASDLLNVKVGLFWTALVPQFVSADSSALLPAGDGARDGLDGLRVADRLRLRRRPPQPGAAAAAQRPRGQRDGRSGLRGARRPARAREPLSLSRRWRRTPPGSGSRSAR